MNSPVESKAIICKALNIAVLLTSAGSDVIDIVYMPDFPFTYDETARICYRNGYTKDVDVTADSGIAMIRDICNAIH